MARVVNSFALLGDEEGDDVAVLVEHFTKKVDVDPAPQEKKQPAQNQPKSPLGNAKAPKFPLSESVRSERGRGRGGRGRGTGRGGFGGNDAEHFGNEQENGYRRNYGEGLNGNGYGDAYRGRGRGRGGNRGRGRGRGFNSENVIRDEKEGSGGNRNNDEDAADGWEQVPQTHARGYGNDINSHRDEERPFSNGNRSYGGERRGYGGGNRGFRGRRDGINYGRGEESNNDEVKENVNDADGNVLDGVSNIAIAEGNADAVTEDPRDVGAEEKKTVEEGFKVDNLAKKDEEEDEKSMTLEEYEKLLAEKRKPLEALKIEERKVTADRDFEAMQLLEKKKEEIVLKPETAKLKKKDSLEKDEKSRKTVSINEFLKPADGEEFFYLRPGRGRGRGARSGDFRNERGFRNNGYPRGGGRGRNSPGIHIEDKGQFPVLKGAAPAVEAA